MMRWLPGAILGVLVGLLLGTQLSTSDPTPDSAGSREEGSVSFPRDRSPEPSSSAQEAPAPAGMVRGRILDAFRRPVADVTVHATAIVDRWPETEEELLPWYADLAREHLLTTPSDADGRFRFPANSGRFLFALSVDHPDYQSNPLRHARVGEAHDLVLKRRGAFRAKRHPTPVLFSAGGVKIPRSEVVRNSGQQQLRDPRKWETISRRDPYRFFAHESLASQEYDKDANPHRVELHPTTVLQGVFRSEWNGLARRLPDGETVHVPVDPWTGRFSVLGFDPGTLEFLVTDRGGNEIDRYTFDGAPGYQRVVWEDRTALAANFTLDLILPEGPPRSNKSNSLMWSTTSDGVSFLIQVEAGPPKSYGGVSGGISPIAIDGRRYSFTVPAWIREESEGRTEDKIQLKVSANGVEGQIRIDPSWSGHYHLDLRESGVLRYEFPGYIGSGREGYFHLELSSEDPRWRYGEFPWEDLRLDENGKGETEPLRDGRYTLKVKRGTGSDIAVTSVHEFEIRGRDAFVSIPFPVSHDLRVEFSEEWIGKRGSLSGTGSRGEQRKTVRFAAVRAIEDLTLLPGIYTLHVDRAQMEIALTASGHVRFEPTTYRALRITHAPSGSLLEKEDVIIAVDGEPFEILEPRGWILQRSAGHQTFVATVQRAGEVLEIVVGDETFNIGSRDRLRYKPIAEVP